MEGQLQNIEKIRYIVDIDGTICNACPGNYTNAMPYKDRILKINSLFDAGHSVIYYTARGMTRFEGNASKCYTEYYEFTKKQLDSWGCKYDQLIMGKPAADHYVDDRGINDHTFFGDLK